ncbi:MAG: peptide deformylase [Burkholderia sp.]|nr:peptide deformylase [Burkholderia sp.]
MALLDILYYPDNRLNKVARPVKIISDRVQKLIIDMAETMYATSGIGLAATQVDIHERVIVIDISEEKNELRVFINPEIIWLSEKKKTYREGCLSVPGIYDQIERSDCIKVRALDRSGKPFSLKCEGLLAVCIQHEMDHLIGRIFIEYLSPLKRSLIKAKMKKLSTFIDINSFTN